MELSGISGIAGLFRGNDVECVCRNIQRKQGSRSELVVAGTCVDLLTYRGIFTGGNEERIEREIFFGVKIVNAGTCAGNVDIFVKEGTTIGRAELTTKRRKGTKGRDVFLCRLACFSGERKLVAK